MRGNYRSMESVRRANEAKGEHWFSAGTMRFFRTRVSDTLYGGALFVTSDVGPRDERAYSVRVAHADGSIGTVGDFLGYRTRRSAHAAAARLARVLEGSDACPCSAHAESA
jgi:hypothetical protein